MKINPQNIKQLIFLPVDFFKPENLLERLDEEFFKLRTSLKNKNRLEAKNELNALYQICLMSIKTEDIRLNVHLFMFDSLIEYSKKFESIETLDNIIKSIEKPELKGKLFSKLPIKSKIIYGQVLFYRYELENRKCNGKFSKELTNFLLKSKFYLLKVYTQHLEAKITLSENQLSTCLSYLSICLSQLSRWFEPIYYLGLINQKNNPNIDYLYAINLDAIKRKTCLDYNGLLILKIIDKCLSVKKNPISHQLQLSQSIELEKENRLLLKKHNLNISTLRNHKKNTTESFKEYNDYKTFCIRNHLYLNEHSFFCNCNSATTDNLSIKTNHQHTQTSWAKNFEEIIESVTYDFINSRYNYYKSLNSTNLNGFYVSQIKRVDSKIKLKNSFLKNSFKMCYSILDQIAYGILQVLNIDYNSILLEKYEEKNKIPKIYFFNIWDEPLFKDSHFGNNFYLISLYSISKDLDNTKFSALREFKQVRNAMEHKIFKISNDKESNLKEGIYNRNELMEKTKLLLLFTKSCILSFNNLIRLESKTASR